MHAVFSAGVFGDPLTYALVKAGCVVAAGQRIEFARNDVGNVFQQHCDFRFFFVDVTERNPAENVAVAFVDGVVVDGKLAAFVELAHDFGKRQMLFYRLAAVFGQVMIGDGAHLLVAVRTVVARDAGKPSGNFVGQLRYRAGVSIENDQSVEMLDKKFSYKIGFDYPIGAGFFRHNFYSPRQSDNLLGLLAYIILSARAISD